MPVPRFAENSKTSNEENVAVRTIIEPFYRQIESEVDAENEADVPANSDSGTEGDLRDLNEEDGTSLANRQQFLGANNMKANSLPWLEARKEQ